MVALLRQLRIIISMSEIYQAAMKVSKRMKVSKLP